MRTRKVIGTFPSGIPTNWELYNAPRPLYGKTWEGDFISGIFYAAIDPSHPDASIWREENRKLDATRIMFVSQDSVIEEMVEYYRERYADDFDEIFSQYPLDDPETHKMLIETWYNLDMNWSEEF
jgi:hypothetical protein